MTGQFKPIPAEREGMTTSLEDLMRRATGRTAGLWGVRPRLESISGVGSLFGRSLDGADRRPYYFEDERFDCFFAWVAAMGTHGGSETGEVFTAAAEIDDGDSESWENAWTRMARRVERLADEAVAAGHDVSAREAYFRAYTYYRAPLFFLSPLEAPRYRLLIREARKCFKRGAALSNPPLEPVEIPFEGATLPGYFVRASGGGSGDEEPRKTLLGLGGGDTFVEDLYYLYAPAAQNRGYNALIVDLPGQGTLPFDGRVMRPDAGEPIGAVVDYALERPEVDPDRLVAVGTSYGGYLLPRAATREDRFAAIVANSVILDTYELWTENAGLAWLARIEGTPLESVFEQVPFANCDATYRALDTYTWRWGVDSVSALLEDSKRYRFDPAGIDCPTLLLAGQEEYENHPAIRRWQDVALERIAHSDTELRITPDALGAGSHSGLANVSVLTATAFDWLDEVVEAGSDGYRNR